MYDMIECGFSLRLVHISLSNKASPVLFLSPLESLVTDNTAANFRRLALQKSMPKEI